jgi:FtsH-binding integral membrane protein
MKERDLNAMRSVLFAAVFILILLTVFIYFYKGTFSIGSLVVAGVCLLIYLVTGKKKADV